MKTLMVWVVRLLALAVLAIVVFKGTIWWEARQAAQGSGAAIADVGEEGAGTEPKLSEHLVFSALEQQLFDDLADETLDAFTFEQGALIVSGIESRERLAEYELKIDEIYKKTLAFVDEDGRLASFVDYVYNSLPQLDEERRRILKIHRSFWAGRGGRYNPSISSLVDVIDAELRGKPGTGVGNCVGLSMLNHVIFSREGYESDVINVPGHVLLRVQTSSGDMYLESTDAEGEIYEEPLPFERVQVADFRALYSDLYTNRGLAMAGVAPLDAVRRCFNQAILLNPECSPAFLARAKILLSFKYLEEAKQDLLKVIQIEEGSSEANRLLERIKVLENAERYSAS